MSETQIYIFLKRKCVRKGINEIYLKLFKNESKKILQ